MDPVFGSYLSRGYKVRRTLRVLAVGFSEVSII